MRYPQVLNLPDQLNKPFKFQCEFCQKPFKDSWSYKCHRRTHTGEKPFKCEKCGKAFSLKGNLKKHWMTHLV